MGKKTVEDSRRFEKDRRDKLNVAFEELSKLLPDHDPSVTFSKIEILRRAAQYIKQLQDQNDEIMKFGSDTALKTESEKLRKRVTHLLIKTKELVDALKCAGVPIPTNKKKRKKKVPPNNVANQNLRASEKQTDVQTLIADGQALRRVRCGCIKTSPERKPLKESNPVATMQTSSVENSASGNNGNVIAVSAPIVAASIQEHEKQTELQTSKEDGQTQQRAKCGCKKTSPNRKPLTESKTTTTQPPSVANITSVASASTTGNTILNSGSVIAVNPPLISAPIMATRIQGIPIVPNALSPSTTSSNPTIIPRHIVPSLNSTVLEGNALGGNRTALTSQQKLSGPVTIASNFVNEIIVPNLNKKTINVVTTTSSNVITTQSIVNSTQLISLPQSNVISNSIVAPRIQNVPLLEKNILSNLGPGTLILADGRIMNVPPIVPQIVVKPQPAVILMSTAKKKEKLLIPKRREVTKTTFSNKSPIPAIKTFRLESCPRVRPKKKPKPIKNTEKTKHGDSISKAPEQNKKRKLEEMSPKSSSGSKIVSEEIRSNDLASKQISTGEELKEVGCESVAENIIVTSIESSVPGVNTNVSNSEGPIISQAGDNLSIPNEMIICLNEISTPKSDQSTHSSSNAVENTPSTSPEAVNTIDQRAPELAEPSSTSNLENDLPENTSLLHETDPSKTSPSFPLDSGKNLKLDSSSDRNNLMNVLPETIQGHQSKESTLISDVNNCNESNSNAHNNLSFKCNNSKSIISSNDILTNIPPCISSSSEQDSIFLLKNKHLPSTENTQSTLPEGSAVQQICSDVERSVNGFNKNLVENELVKSNPHKALDRPPSSQQITSCNSKNLTEKEFSESNCKTDNSKPIQENAPENPMKEPHTINFVNRSDFTSSNNGSVDKENHAEIEKLDKANQEVNLNAKSRGNIEITEVSTNQTVNYSQSGPNLCEASICTKNVTTSHSFISGKRFSSGQTVPTTSEEKNFSHQGNHPPTNTLAFPNISNDSVIPSNNIPISSAASSTQVLLPSHSSYGISGIHSEKDYPFFNGAYSKQTTFNTNEKANSNRQNSGQSTSDNIFPIYSSSTFSSNGAAPNTQSSFNLKPAENSGNILHMSAGRNADVYTSFNQTLPTDTSGDKPFYSQNVSFSHNSLPRSSNWDKTQFNKSIYGSTYVDGPEETNPKTTIAFPRNKNGSFDKPTEHTQLTYLGFQNESSVTSQSNTFFHNMLPSSCGYTDTPGVFSYHNTSTSVVSSYSFIPPENVTSHNTSAGRMKNVHQDRAYFPEITSAEKNKGATFGSNDKSSIGNSTFYPSTSQTLTSNVYPASSQSSLATVYSTFPQPTLSNVYSSSSQLSTTSYPNFTQQNALAYPNANKGVGVHPISTHPTVSSVYNNFSHPNASVIYSTSTTSNAFIKPTQSTSSIAYSASGQHSISNVKSANSHSYLNPTKYKSSLVYKNPPQTNMPNAYVSSAQASASMSYVSTMQPAYSTSVIHSSANISARSYPMTPQTNLLGVFPNTPAPEISRVYAAAPIPDSLCTNTNSSLPANSNNFSSSTQTNVTKNVNRSSSYSGVNDSPLLQSEVVLKPKQTSESSGSIPLNSYKSSSGNSSTSSEIIQPTSASSKTSDLVLANHPTTLHDTNKSKESSNLPTTLADSNLNNQRHNSKSMQSPYSHDKDISTNKYTTSTNTVTLDQRTPASERSVTNVTEKEPCSQISTISSNSVELPERNKSSELHKYNNYDFIAYKGKDIQNKPTLSNKPSTKSNDSVDKSIQSNFKNFVKGQNCDDKSLETESNKLLPNSNQKSVSTEVIQGDMSYNYNSNPTSTNYSKQIQTSTTSFTASQPNLSAQNKAYSNFNSLACETVNNNFNSESTSNPRSVSTLPLPQPNEPQAVSSCTGPPPELLNKTAMMDITQRPEKQDKSIQKSYESGATHSHLKGDVTSDFLKSKDIERNTFIPIIDDVRLPTDFSSDLFSSLQVPTGGAHSESISPTAAFLLAFPLVSTSRNVENLHDNDNQENQTSTPTTILQIGNIDPPSTELFHPIDFQKGNPKPDHFDINNDYLHVNDLNDKHNQNPYKRCEKRKDTFTEYSKEVRPTDPKQKSKSSVVTTSTYTQSYSQPLLSCSEFQYCEKDSSQWQQEFPPGIPKEQKKTCDRKKEKAVQKGCFQQTYSECYNYKEKKRKQQNRISVNWMTTPENREQSEYQAKETELVNSVVGPPAQSLYGGIPLDFPTEPFPDFCNSKKTNNYSWSPNKMLLPSLDNHLMIPSTLPTLVGDLALGTSTPSESYKTYDVPKSQSHISKKPTDKVDLNKKQNEFSKNQANFFSVSQLVDPKSKKQKTGERNCKRPDKNSKPRNSFNCPKRKDDQCMYYEDRNSFAPNQNQYNEKRHPYKGNYSAESLIGAQHNEIDFSSSFNYQQNTNYFQSEFPPTVEPAGQQYGYFQQTHFASFNHDECQEFGFNTSQRTLDNNRQKASSRKDENYQGAGLLQPQICPPYTKSMNYIPSSHLNTNTTTTLTNFNLSTIFPEMNDQRVGSSVQPPQQMNSTYSNSQNYRNHIS